MAADLSNAPKMAEKDIKETPYPAKSSTIKGGVSGIPTEVEIVYFLDKIMVNVSQGGRLAQWIQVPLAAPSAASVDAALPPTVRSGGETGLLPSTHLTPRTLFGAGGEARETFGHLVAAQIGSLLSLRDDAEGRMLLVGLGLDPTLDIGQKAGSDHAQAQAVYFDIIELAQKVL